MPSRVSSFVAGHSPELVSAIPDSGSRAVHVLEQNARLHLEDGLLAITLPDQPAVRLRLPEIDSVSIHGRAGISTPCLHALMAEGIPVIWRGANGWYLGQTVGPASHGSARRRAQYTAQGTPLGLAIARRLVAGKVANMRALLGRRTATSPACARAMPALDALLPRIAVATDADTLRGFEGAASAAYFGCWPELLKGPASRLGFPGRSRRPPLDPLNAALSYGYAVVAGHGAAAALAAGLDPAEGFLHATRAGRPALALDLLEPFRPAIVDTSLLFAANTGELGEGDFTAETDGPGISLTDRGRRKVLKALERRLAERVANLHSVAATWRDAIGQMASTLAHTLLAGSPDLLAVPVRR